jgi:hypothetical protein
MPLTKNLEKKCFTLKPERIEYDFCVGDRIMWKHQMDRYLEFKENEEAKLRNKMKREYKAKHPKEVKE